MILEEYSKLINSKEFKNWKNKHKDAYLSSCLLITDEASTGIWGFDFYLPNINKITTFELDNVINIKEDQEIFEQRKKKLKEINLNNLKFNLNEVNKFIDKNFNNKKFIKKIIILQYLQTLLWNITLLSLDFNITNVKLDAKNGKLLEQSTKSILQFKAS